MPRQITTLLANATATGADVLVGGGRYHLMVTATNFNGATVKLQTKAPDGSYIDVGAEATFTANGQAIVELGERTTLRINISVAVPVGVNAVMAHVPGAH